MHRPEDVKDRISNIQQIEDIIVAMRGLAAAHSMDARKHLIAIKTYEATVAEAIAHALACAPGLTPVADEKTGTAGSDPHSYRGRTRLQWHVQ